MTIYLIHFSKPHYHARHYLGFVDGDIQKLNKRLEKHRKGTGAKLMKHISSLGISWELAKIWEGGSRTTERRLKKWKKIWRLCPICKNEEKAGNRIICRRRQKTSLILPDRLLHNKFLVDSQMEELPF